MGLRAVSERAVAPLNIFCRISLVESQKTWFQKFVFSQSGRTGFGEHFLGLNAHRQKSVSHSSTRKTQEKTACFANSWIRYLTQLGLFFDEKCLFFIILDWKNASALHRIPEVCGGGAADPWELTNATHRCGSLGVENQKSRCLIIEKCETFAKIKREAAKIGQTREATSDEKKHVLAYTRTFLQPRRCF